MEQRVYHGAITPEGLAQALLDEWDREQTVAQAFGENGQVIVQIGQREAGWFSDEPRQAMTLTIEPIGDGIRVNMGQQQWYKENDIQVFGGGFIGFFPFFLFPLGGGGLFGGDEGQIDQRLPSLIWQSIDRYAGNFGAATGATRRLSTVACPECGVANPQGATSCSACGTQLSAVPVCPQCGYQNPVGANFCNRCGTRVGQPVQPSA